MTSPRILLQEDEDKPPLRPPAGRPDLAWSVLGWVGLVLALVGCADWAFVWYPLPFGNSELEFRALSRTYDALPLLTIGLGFALGAGIALGRRWLMVVSACLMLLAAVWLAVMGLRHLVFLVESQAPLTAIADPLGIKRGVQGLLYPALFLGLGGHGLKRASAIE